MRIELLTRQEEITELREELSRKRKREEELKEDSKKLRVEEKARFLEKCNDELKCSICDDIFVEVINSSASWTDILENIVYNHN